MNRIILFLLFLIFLFSCGNHQTPEKKSIEKNSSLEFAKGFQIQKNDYQTKLTVENPWQGSSKVKFEYHLIPKKQEIEIPQNEKNIIRTPIEKVVCFSTTYLSFIESIDCEESIIGVSGTDFVYSEKIRKNIFDGKIADVGFSSNLNIEQLAKISPDVIFLYSVAGETDKYFDLLKELNIAVVFIGDYLENEPLGRSEWIKFFAPFFEKEEVADSIFRNIKLQYNNVLAIVPELENKPKVMLGLPWRDAWYIPGKYSFAAKFINNAGGKYIWDLLETHESKAINIESIISKCWDADVWINPGSANSLKEIENTDYRLAELKSLKAGNVFNNNKRVNSLGGNDYWESGAVNPHLILQDLMSIFYPDSNSAKKTYFYQKLE